MKIEYDIKSLPLLHLVDECIKKHKQVFENRKMRWDKGDVTGIWRDSDGSVRISYENGQWFHYREEDGDIVWK
ncbi:hypothetical protein D3Z53_25980 [Lachnospiraceae bacterium]|nr:hypothetical protein [uncultured Schaedlerella sp.]NBI61342.1 hypothetical protein [Lachnospiraceae bacterium]